LLIAKAQKSAKVANAPVAQPWVQGAGAIQYMSVNTPVEAATPADHCGRFIHTDLHVSGNSSSFSDQGTRSPTPATPASSPPKKRPSLRDLRPQLLRHGRGPQAPAAADREVTVEGSVAFPSQVW
jgi:hypothetical protein